MLNVNQSGLRAPFDCALIDAVRSSFPDLIQICRMLRSTKEHLDRVCVHFDKHHSDASTFALEVENRLHKTEVAISRRNALLDIYDQVRILRQVAQALNFLEKLLESTSTGDELAAMLTLTTHRLRSASSECGRMMLVRGCMTQLAAGRCHAVRIDSARSKLISHLCDCTNAALFGGTTRTGLGPADSATSLAGVNGCLMSHLLHGFAEVEADDEAATLLRSAGIAPRLMPRLVAKPPSLKPKT